MADEPLNGKAFVARVRLSDAQDRTFAVPGETCDRVPETSLPWLLEQEWIEPAPMAAPATETPAAAPSAPAADQE